MLSTFIGVLFTALLLFVTEAKAGMELLRFTPFVCWCIAFIISVIVTIKERKLL